MHHYLQRSILTLLLPIILVVLPHDMDASPGPFISVSNKEVISRINSLATHESKFGTIVNILGNGKIGKYVTKTIESPPKILVDILCTPESLETTKLALASPNLKGLRVGHHSQKIRLVLDLKGTDLPYFATQSVDNELTILIRSRGIENLNESMPNKIYSSKSAKEENDQAAITPNEAQPPISTNEVADPAAGTSNEAQLPISTNEIMGQEPGAPNEGHRKKSAEEITAVSQPVELETDDRQQNTAFSGSPNPAKELDAVVPPTIKDYTFETETQGKRYAVRILEHSEGVGSKKAIYRNNLTRSVLDDGQDDTAFLIESLNAYETQNWLGAIENLTHLIKMSPAGRYTERAYFLLAKAYEQQHLQSTTEHFDEIKKHYDDASYKFPASEYLPEAYFGIGNLYFKIGNYYEALAYYNLVVKKAKGSSLAARALIQKVTIMLQAERKKEALSVSSVLEDVVSRLPDTPLKTEAKILRAKILYEFNKYGQSLDILSELLRTNPQNIYQHPIISLYLGFNYYQLEDNTKARENLLRFYNSHPNQEMNDLVLTQIGDTYRNEGRIKEATSFYQLVLKRYSNMEGAVISKIRLAELQEERELVVASAIVPPVNILDEDMALAAEFYKEIINNPLNKKNETPLTQLALLKLSIIYQKEKKYKKSLEHLKTLFVKYPRSKLIKEGQQALARTIDAMFKEEQQAKRYTNIINFYLAEKELVWGASDPELFLSVARAFMQQNFEDMATELFKQADLLLSDEEKPSDLLFLLGQDFYKQAKLKSALKRFSLLIDNYPSDKNVPYAYRMKGNILLKQKRYPLAAKMFAAALKYPVDKCERLSILIGKATALAESNSDDKALEATKEADVFIRSCSSADYQIYQEIGDLYFGLGDIQKSVAVYNQAVDMAQEQADKISLMLKIAQCYWRLNQKEDFLALNERISSLNDPFWSNLAKERMEEINFNWEMQKTKAEWKKGKKS